MSENTIKIGVEVGAGLQKASKEFKDLQTRVKELDYEFRKQKISADGLKIGIADVEKNAKALNLTYKQTIDLSAQIFQVNQRAINSFKSMSGSFRDLQQAQHLQTQASNRSQQGFVALAYIIQDLPYGIRGVANNITQLSQVLGTPIWLNMAISGFTSLAVVFSNMKKNTEEATEAMKDMMDTVKLFAKYGMSFGMAGNLDIAKATIKAKIQGMQTTIEGRGAAVGESYTFTKTGFDSEVKRLQAELKVLEEYETANKKVLDAERERARVHGIINLYVGAELETLLKMEKEGEGSGSTRWTGEYQFGSKFGDVGGLTGGEGLSPFQRKFFYLNSDQKDPEAESRKYTRRRGFLNDLRNSGATGRQKDADESNKQGIKFWADLQKQEAEDLREAMQIANSVFFNPMRSAFESIITGSANMADAFEKAIKQMLASLIANAALAAAISLITGIPFVPIFQGLNGIPASGGGGGFRPPVLPDPLTLKRGFSFGGGSPGIRVEVVGKIGNDAIYLAGNRYLSDKNAARI